MASEVTVPPRSVVMRAASGTAPGTGEADGSGSDSPTPGCRADPQRACRLPALSARGATLPGQVGMKLRRLGNERS